MNQRTRTFAAVDLGATSGRVMLGRVGPGTLEMRQAHRFANTPVQTDSGLYWDIRSLYQAVLDGLREAGRVAQPASIGIDSWAVDYGLLDAEGGLLGDPRHYRDPRTGPEAIRRVWDRIGPADLYRLTGVQHQPFNTVFQLSADAGSAGFASARTLLLIPDLLTYWLTGSIGAEVTNASTTGLFHAAERTWSPTITAAAGINPAILPPLRAPGDRSGPLLPGPLEHTDLAPGTQVTVVASHDTASAVAAVPADRPGFAYISCGTWSLAGLELDAPVLSQASQTANFTNELGVDGTVRYLRNIMGLWLLSECQRTWAENGRDLRLPQLLAQAAAARPFAALVNPDDPSFVQPGDMPARIAGFCERTAQTPPATPGAMVRCILESLALAHRQALRQAAKLADREIDVVHLVGGGSRNELLCQWTADATGLPLIAGPAEATALGNTLVQARAHGSIGDLSAMRALIADTHGLRRYFPRGGTRPWDAGAARVGLT